jgi:hypothetical protein
MTCLKIARICTEMGGASKKFDNILFLQPEHFNAAGHLANVLESLQMGYDQSHS